MASSALKTVEAHFGKLLEFVRLFLSLLIMEKVRSFGLEDSLILCFSCSVLESSVILSGDLSADGYSASSVMADCSDCSFDEFFGSFGFLAAMSALADDLACLPFDFLLATLRNAFPTVPCMNI